MKCYFCGKEMKELKCAECGVVDYQCDCGWGVGHSHDHSKVIDSKDLGPTLSSLYELDVVKQKLAYKDKEIEILKKALELACEKVTNDFGVDSDEIIYKKWFDTFYNDFIDEAEKLIKGENK